MYKKPYNSAAPTLPNLNVTGVRWNVSQWIELLYCFHRDELAAVWFPCAKQFYEDNPDGSWGDVSTRAILTRTVPKANSSKETLCQFSFAVLKNKEIFTDFFNSLPELTRKILTIATWVSSLDRQQMEKELGISILNEEHQLLPELRILRVTESNNNWRVHTARETNWEKWDATFCLPEPLRILLKDYLEKPEDYYIKPLEQATFQESVHVFSAEDTIFHELPRLLAYHQQGKFKYNLHGKPTPANIKKVAKELKTIEFFPDHPEVPTRTNMLIGLLYEYAENKTTLEDVIKVLFQEHFYWNLKNSNHPLTHAPLYLFNYLTGMNTVEPAFLTGTFNDYLKSMLQKLPVGKWVTKKNYLNHLSYNSIPVEPFLYERENRLYFKKDGDYGYVEKENIDDENFPHLIARPYANGLIFVLAAFGILEIAYYNVDRDEEFGYDWFSEYDGLEAFRLTPLGAYALGITDSYEAPVKLATNKFIFDADALMLRVEGNLGIIDVMLEQFLEKTSANRYAFNTGLFLGDCKTPHDIEVKINLFKQTINTPLSQFWQNHLNQLLENAKSIRQKREVVIYQIDVANKDLQRLMAQDAVLKSLMLKAEQFHVLIPTKNLLRFQSRMKELGYLVEK